MKRILKYPIAVQSEQLVRMPHGSRVLSAGLDPAGVPCLWALVDETMPPTDVGVLCVGTGHEIKERHLELVSFVGTVAHGPFMWHVFVSKDVA